MTNILVLDTETGGLSPVTDALLTVHARLVDPVFFHTIDQIDLLVHPQNRLVHAGALVVNKIQIEFHKLIADTPEVSGEKLKRFFDVCQRHGDFIIVGHYIDFDLNFCDQILPGTRNKYGRKTVDTRSLSTFVRTQNLVQSESASLQHMRAGLNIQLEDSEAHTSSGDVDVTLELYKIFAEKMTTGFQIQGDLQ